MIIGMGYATACFFIPVYYPVTRNTYRLTLGCRKYTRGSYQYCSRAKPESGTDH